MDEIYTYARSSDHVDESKSTRLLRFRLMFGETVRSFRSESKMGNQAQEFQQSNSYRELLGTDGEPIDFEWNIFSRVTSLEILQKIQKDVQDRHIEPEDCEDRIIFMSMFNDIEWIQKGNSEQCISKSEQVKNNVKRFSRGHWTFLDPGGEKKWYGTLSKTPEGKRDSTATQMVERFKETGHPVFKSISTLARGILRRKSIRDTIHFDADASNTELFVSSDSLGKSAQYLRSNLKLVRRVRSEAE